MQHQHNLRLCVVNKYISKFTAVSTSTTTTTQYNAVYIVRDFVVSLRTGFSLRHIDFVK